MDLTQYVDELCHQLLAAAAAGGEDTRQLADRLVAPLQSATRLVLLEALSAAAGEITSELAPGSVDVRLRGREPEFVVTAPAVDLRSEVSAASPEPAPRGSGGPVGDDGGDGGNSRVTLRLPEPLKLRIEEAAGREGLSVNSWLVRTLAGVLEPTERNLPTARRIPTGGERFTGWSRS